MRGLSERLYYEKLSEMKKFDENRKTWNEMKKIYEPYITRNNNQQQTCELLTNI